jgi:predicted dehydrogenase
MLKCGIIGLGALGKAHFKNILELERSGEPVRLAALCDVDESQLRRAAKMNIGDSDVPVGIEDYPAYSDARDMLENEKLDFVVSAVPSHLHADIAIMAMSHGAHAFSEKPMALTKEGCERMAAAAKANRRLLMIGHCLRYWPEYVELKKLIESGSYGKAVSASFYRRSAFPRWSWQNWFADHEKSGGAAMDLHVHDTDMVLWLFGPPTSVFSSAAHQTVRFDSISTIYSYPDKMVSASGGWDVPESHPFEMGFMARLERAAARFDSQGFAVYTEEGVLRPELPRSDAYKEEMRDFIHCVIKGEPSSVNPYEDSIASAKIALAEKESAEKGESICVKI